MRRSPRIGALALAIILPVVTPALADDEPAAHTRASSDSYPHKAVKRQEFGIGVRSYWIFEPDEPTLAVAPVIVFHHGWLAVNPAAYGAWIDHLVRRGQIVIFPRYQLDLATRPAEFLTNALEAVRDAFDVLETSPKHIKPDRERFALIGHSAGGNLSAQMAAVALENHLPVPKALVILMPGEVQPAREPALSRISPTTLLVVTAAEDDRIVGDVRARQIFASTTSIATERKKYVLYRSDRHGFPWLVADHTAPTAAHREFDTGDGVLRGFQLNRAELNAFDYAGFWRMADITLDAAFAGKTLDEATDRGELFRHLGYWSDGRAVARPVVGDDLSIIPRVFPTGGLRLIQWTSSQALDTPQTRTK